jgi:hypothetical protein
MGNLKLSKKENVKKKRRSGVDNLEMLAKRC